MKKTSAMIVATVGVLTVYADTNSNPAPQNETAPPIVQEKKYPWESKATAGLSLTSGNKDTLLFTAGIGTKRTTPENEWDFGAALGYGKADSVKNIENYSAFGQYNHLFNEHFYGYVRADFLRDTIADLRYRFTISPGAGYYLIKDKQTQLAVEAGPGVVFRDLGGESETFGTLRLAERFEHKFENGNRIWQSVEFLPDVGAVKNFIANFELGAEASLSKDLSLRIVFSDTYNSEPAPGRKGNDLKLVSGIAYKF